jgi:hypothetical protein
MLELAAKAARLVVVSWDDGVQSPYVVDPERPSLRPWCWMPLLGNDDALRLAVGLRIDVRIGSYDTLAYQSTNTKSKSAAEKHDDFKDPSAATRRAIVRAAAEIGKAMP